MSIDWRSYKLRLRMWVHGQWRKHYGSDMSISLFNALLHGPVLRVASLLNGNLSGDALNHSDNWGERSEPCTSEVNANCLYVCHRPTCMYVIDRPVALRMRRNMLSTCCSCARPTNALHSPSILSMIKP